MESQAAVMLGRPQGIPYQEVDAEVFTLELPLDEAAGVRDREFLY
jgi:hypothetical protein